MSTLRKHSWTEIRDRVHARILASQYAPGDKLPRDTDLADEFGCARSTVHRAMQALSDSGIVERRRRGGTTVPHSPVTRARLDIPVIRSEIEARGSEYGYRLIRHTRQTTPGEIATIFQMDSPREMLRVEALHLADGRPYVFEDRWLCLETVPEILAVDLSRLSANEWLVRNRPYSRCDLNLYARSAGAKDAERLATEVGEALLVIERTTWIGSNPITSVRALTAPGYKLSAQL